MILLLGFLMMTGVAVAQQLQVQGKVTDATGEGLIGASVLVKGTTSGVITDIDGNYVLLNVNPDAILIFSYALNPQLHSRSATYIKRNGLLIRKTAIKSSHPFQCAYYPLTPQSDLRQYAISGHQVM